jgi:hypothetical protein
MKRLIKLLFLFTLLGVVAGGCQLFQGVKWDESYWYVFQINPADAGTHGFTREDIPTEINQILDENNINANRVKSVVIKEVKATIQSGSLAKNFDIMDSGKLYMNGDGLSPVTVAWWPDPIPSGQTSLILDHTSEELKDHLLTDQLSFAGEGYLNAAHEGTTWVRVDITFEITGKVLF